MNEIFRRLLRALSPFDTINLTLPRRINGRGFRIPIIRKIGYGNLHDYEAWMVDLLRGLLPLHAGTFVDVGANVGQTLLRVKSLDPARPYLGFEPNPACAFYLHELIAANRLADARVVPAGLSTGAGVIELAFYADDRVDSEASIVPPAGRPVHHRQVVVLSDIAPALAALAVEQISIIKIDVEGAELQVMTGLRGTVAGHRPPILIEILPARGQPARLESRLGLQALISALDYVILRVDETPKGGLAALARIDALGDQAANNYMLYPREKYEGHHSFFERLPAAWAA